MYTHNILVKSSEEEGWRNRAVIVVSRQAHHIDLTYVPEASEIFSLWKTSRHLFTKSNPKEDVKTLIDIKFN